jgi:hypothetical protein
MSARPHTNLFTQVDRTEDPDFFVRFMDEAQKPPGIQASKRLMLERAALASGEAALDVGCGPGNDLFDMVEHVGPTGRCASRRPDGRIVVFDFDWDTLIIDHPDRQTTRNVVLTYSDSIQNGGIGRQLPRLFAEQHLEVLSIDPVQVFVHYALAELFLGSHLVALQANGALRPDEAERWWEAREGCRQGRVNSATRPSARRPTRRELGRSTRAP